MWFIDNLGVLASLAAGGSRVHDFGNAIHSVLLSIANLRAKVWWEHVDTHANPADGGTRSSATVANSLGIELVAKPLPPWPDDIMSADSEFWLSWIRDLCGENLFAFNCPYRRRPLVPAP